MSAHRAHTDLAWGAGEIADPGSGGTIRVNKNLGYVPIVTAAAESRTLAAPDRVGLIVTLVLKTDGGDCTLTVTNGYDLAALTTYTFTDALQAATFVSVYNGTTYYWRLLNNAAQQVPAVILATTRTVRQDENGKTFWLNLAGAFVTTLPAPFLGGHYKFIVKTAPSGASYTIVTASSANVFVGSISTAQDAGGSASSDDDGDTISFVDAKALPGDSVELDSDGTSWAVKGQGKVFDAITITKAS